MRLVYFCFLYEGWLTTDEYKLNIVRILIWSILNYAQVIIVLYKCVYTLFGTIFCDMVASNIDTFVSVDVILITPFALDQESQM